MIKNMETDNETRFVHYTPNEQEWKYDKLPTGWWWVGGGSTYSLDSNVKSPKYTREEQFSGPQTNSNEIDKFLKKKFDNLLDEKKILNFKITKTFGGRSIKFD